MDLTALLDKAPELGVILIIVVVFLKALSKRDCTLKDIADNCHQMRRDGVEATRENTRVLGQTAEVIREAMALLRTMNGKR